MRSAKKENSERHSQRCDIELKLAVSDYKGSSGTSFTQFYSSSNVPLLVTGSSQNEGRSGVLLSTQP